ncbi:MAG TPA: type II toxin-antitoxin system VapC family toxin [Candidatus Limnocylindrales bacterium]
MTVLCDTSVIIDLLRGVQPAVAWARSLSGRPACSEVTRVEVLRGLRTQERRTTDRLFGTLSWIPVDETIARRAGELGRAWRGSHRGIATADLIIAASADVAGLGLATLNVKHFPMFAGLTAPYEPSMIGRR